MLGQVYKPVHTFGLLGRIAPNTTLGFNKAHLRVRVCTVRPTRRRKELMEPKLSPLLTRVLEMFRQQEHEEPPGGQDEDGAE